MTAPVKRRRRKPGMPAVHACTAALPAPSFPETVPAETSRIATAAPAPCQAIIDDHARPAVYAPRQRISSPGDKPCMRRAAAKLGALCLCAMHLRLAQEGMLKSDGRMLDKSTIRDIRDIRVGRRNRRARQPDFQFETWHLNLTPEPIR